MFAGGTGTKEDPYLIETREHLEALEEKAYYLQIADIDLGDAIWEFNPWLTDISYDGGGHTIKNLNGGGKSFSLFGDIYYWGDFGDGHHIKNIKLENAIIESDPEANQWGHLGGIFEYIETDSTDLIIENIEVDMEIVGDISQYEDSYYGYFGGLGCHIYNPWGNVHIRDCQIGSILKGGSLIGGFLGHLEVWGKDETIVERCSVNTEITEVGFGTGNGQAGLFCGSITLGNGEHPLTLRDCYAKGSISAASDISEGLAFLGGFAGAIGYWGDGKLPFLFENCYVVCDFTNISQDDMLTTYGFAGKGEADVNFSKWGFVPTHEEFLANSNEYDEFLDPSVNSAIEVKNCYFNEGIGGLENEHSVGRSTEEMKQIGTFENWDIGDVN